MQTQQQRPELPVVTLTWHECKYKVHKLRGTFLKIRIYKFHQKYILRNGGL